jgi:mono/diheme cytochrome c family protein
MSRMAAAPSLALLLACFAASGVGCVDRTTDEAGGALLYRRHCASCHGVSGEGDGPLAASLQERPTDLTTLARRAGGRFDEAAVMMAIDGRLLVEAHGPRDMPVWGAVFQQEHVGEPFAMYGPTLDARALADYLRSIQKP